MNFARPEHGYVDHGHRCRGSYRNNQPYKRRQNESAKRDQFQDERMPGAEVPDDAICQQE